MSRLKLSLVVHWFLEYYKTSFVQIPLSVPVWINFVKIQKIKNATSQLHLLQPVLPASTQRSCSYGFQPLEEPSCHPCISSRNRVLKLRTFSETLHLTQGLFKVS